MQGHLVNGSAGKVVDFLNIGQALARHIEIATIQPKGEADKNEATLPTPPASLKPMSGKVFEKNQLWPLVHFTNGMDLLCAPLAFTVEGFKGNIEAHRLQVPLILAWALSIHKSQGQTLSRVKVDLRRIFEKGQGKGHLDLKCPFNNIR
jgi:ATP-dependent DNA helicase PIF1